MKVSERAKLISDSHGYRLHMVARILRQDAILRKRFGETKPDTRNKLTREKQQYRASDGVKNESR